MVSSLRSTLVPPLLHTQFSQRSKRLNTVVLKLPVYTFTYVSHNLVVPFCTLT